MNSILNFNPRALVNNNDNASTAFSSIIYRCNPKNAISEDGHYRATIKVIFNPFSYSDSLIERQVYSLNDENGWFEVCSSLTVNDTSCPIFKAWKTLRYSKDPEHQRWAASEMKGGTGWFQKRTERWVTIQVIEDANQPDLVGNYMLWKVPSAIWRMIENKQAPSIESGKPSIPVMDFLIGRAIELDVTPGPDDPSDPSRKNREIKYDLSALSEDPVACTYPDGSSLLSAEQEEIVEKYISMMKKVWKEKDIDKRNKLYEQVNADPNTQQFAEFYDCEIVPRIKDLCPNVKEEMSFKPWSDELTARVNHWLSKVTNGIDPQTPDENPLAGVQQPQQQQAASTPLFSAHDTQASQPVKESTPTVQPVSFDDELPF